jgi:hypothetical protein
MSEQLEVIDIDLTPIQEEAKQTTKTLKDLKDEVKDLRKSLDNTALGSDEFGKTLTELTKKQQELTNVTKSGIAAQKGSYNDLVNQMKLLQMQFRSTADESQRVALGKQINEINTQLKELDASIGNHQRNVGNYKMILKGLKEELLTLEEGTEEYNAKLKEAAEISQKMQDVNEFVSASANDLGDHIKNVSGAMAGLTGAFQTVQASMNLFGIESESIEKTIATMQQLMAITQGLTAIEGAVDPIKRLGVALKGTAIYQKLFTTSVQGSNVALSGFKKALVATGIGAVVVAIGSLIAYWDDLKEMLGSTTNAQEEYNESVKKQAEAENERQKKLTESTGSIIAQYKLLQLEWRNLTNEQEKQKWIEKNANAFKQLGLNIKDVNDANRLLIEDSEKVVKSLRLQTEALILRDSYTEAYKRKMESEKTLKGFNSLNLNPNKYYSADEYDSIPLPDDVKDELFDTHIKQSLTGVSYRLNETAFQTYNSTYRKSITDADKEIKELEARITDIDVQLKSLNTQTDNDSSTTTSTTTNNDVEDRKKLQEDYLKWWEDFQFKVEQSQRDEYEREKSELEKQKQEQLEILKKSFSDGLITETQYKEQQKTIVEFYDGEIDKINKQRIKENLEKTKEEISKYKETIESEISKIQTDTERKLTKNQRQYESSIASTSDPIKQREATKELLDSNRKVLKDQKDQLLKQQVELESQITLLDNLGVKNEETKLKIESLRQLLTQVQTETENVDYSIQQNQQDTANNEIETSIIRIDRIKGLVEETRNSLNSLFEIGPDNPLQNELGAVFDFIQNGLSSISDSLSTGGKGWSKYGQLAAQGLSMASGILTSIADKQDASTKEGFEKQKQLQIAAATMGMLSGIVSAVTSAFNPANAWMTIWGQAAAAATMSSLVLATGIMQINEIKKQTLNGGGSSTSVNIPSPSMTALQAIQNPVQTTNSIEGSSEESKNTRVYVLESDITNVQNDIKTIVSESTY